MRILLLGDLILDEPDPASTSRRPRAAALGRPDGGPGRGAALHARRPSTDIPAPPADPDLAALAHAGLDVATLAGNHIYDAGPNRVEDTVATLHELGIGPQVPA